MLRRRFSYAIAFAIAVIFLGFSLPANAHPFDVSSGDGTSSTSPYLISTCEQLQLIDSEDGIYLNSHFALANDIDCATTTTWNEDSENPGTYLGFKPIGSSTAAFTGSFDGSNYHINDLYIDRGSSFDVGLFSYASSTSTTTPEFKNINFGDSDSQSGKADFRFASGAVLLGSSYGEVIIDNVNVYADVVGESSQTGGIAGYIGGEVKNSSFTGTIDSDGTNTGGLIGLTFTDGSIESIISNCEVDADIISSSSAVGGLAGHFVGSVYNSNFEGSISASNNYIGGLIGLNPNSDYHHEIVNSFVNTDIESSEDSYYVGGLAGDFRGSVASSSYTGNIEGGSYVGGLIGSNTSVNFEYIISNSYVEASIISSSTEAGYVGGLGGMYYGSVASSSFIGDINVKGASSSNGASVGGLIGYNSQDTEITNSFVEANIVSEGYDNGGSVLGGRVGGLGGFFRGSVINSSFIGTIESYGTAYGTDGYVGGLVGYSYVSSLIEDSFVKADIIAEGDYVGGLGAVYSITNVSNSYFEGTINSNGNIIGGLFGFINGGTITNSFVKAEIISTSDSVGGVYGNGGADILSSFFSGNIEGRDKVGGLNGSGSGGVASSSFSTGNITGRDIVGGISGQNINTFNCYSDMDITITGDSGIAAGISANLYGTSISDSYFSGSLTDASSEQNNNLYGISDNTSGSKPQNSFWLESSGATIGAPSGFDDYISSTTEEELKTLDTFSSDWNISDINNHTDEYWYINENYDYPRLFWEDKEFYLEYEAIENGSISGSSTQVILEGESGSQVTAIPDDGYEFVSWSDGNTSASRQDLNIDSNLVVTANFEKKKSSSSFKPKACQIVEYGEWQEVLPGFDIQYREVISSSPSGCYLTQEQRKEMEREVNQEEQDNSQESNEENQEEENNDNGSDVDVNSVMQRERSMVRNVNRELSNRLSGRILLQVEEGGQAWYVDKDSTNKYFMGRPADAFNLMRRFGLGISEDNYNNFLNNGVPSKYAGKILLRVENNGEAYYVNPDTLEMHYLGRPADAFKLMRELALGISNDNIRQIPVGEE